MFYQASRINIATHSMYGPRDSKANKEDPDWKSDHLKLFHGFDKVWPVQNFDFPDGSILDPSGLF